MANEVSSSEALVATGRAALEQAQWVEARAAFKAALAVEASPEAHDGLGLAMWWLNDVAGAHEQRMRAFVGYKARGDIERAAHLAAWLAREQVFLGGNTSAMQGWFAQGERLLEGDATSVARGWLDIYRATMTADTPALARVADAVMALARRREQRDLAAFALVNKGYALVAGGRVDAGMAAIDEAMVAATSGELTDLFVVTEIFCVTLSACQLAGDLVRTRQWCEVAQAYAERFQSPFLSAYCRTTYGGLMADTGRWPDAERALRAAIEAFEAGHRALRVHAVLRLAELRVDQGRLEEATVLLAGYEDHDAALVPTARLQLARGRPGAARALLAHALAGPTDSLLTRVPLLDAAVDVWLALGDVDAARRWAGELGEIARQAGSALLAARAALAEGRVAQATGDPGAAERFQAALRHLARYEDSLLAARAKLALARELRERDTPGATMWARAARAGFERLGAGRGADEAAGLLRDLGAAPGPGERATEALTKREQEVLALLAHGLTNREIAERLVISPKTAEHHVGRILNKLGVRSRVEAAAYATRWTSGDSGK